MRRASSGQALTEYALIVAVLLGALATARILVGDQWDLFLEHIGVLGLYSDSYDTLLSLPFP